MKTLGISAKERFTPGCLRAGGTVYLYLSDVPIADLLWRLRLQRATTLEHYLQETAAVSSLLNLTDVTRNRIHCLPGCFEACIDSLASATLVT